MMRQIGKAMSILARHEASEIMMHADVDLFDAPSECHGLVARGEAKRRRTAWRHAKAVSGLTGRQFRLAAMQVSQKAFDRAVAQMLPDWL